MIPIPTTSEIGMAEEYFVKAALSWFTATALWHWIVKDWISNVRRNKRDTFGHPHHVHHVKKGEKKHGPNVPTA